MTRKLNLFSVELGCDCSSPYFYVIVGHFLSTMKRLQKQFLHVTFPPGLFAQKVEQDISLKRVGQFPHNQFFG